MSGDEYEGLPPSFAKACRAADEKRRRQRVNPAIERARRLLESGTTLERVWQETNHPWRAEGRAAESTVEALMLGLRERGTAALREPKVRRRLSELSDEQVIEVGTRLRKLKPEIARPWTAEQVAILMQMREQLK